MTIDLSDIRSVATTQLVKNLNAERLYGYLGSAYLRYQHNPVIEESITEILTSDCGMAGFGWQQISGKKGFPSTAGGTLIWGTATATQRSLLYVAQISNSVQLYFGSYSLTTGNIVWNEAKVN